MAVFQNPAAPAHHLTLLACPVHTALSLCSGTVVRVGPGKMAEDGQRKVPKVRRLCTRQPGGLGWGGEWWWWGGGAGHLPSGCRRQHSKLGSDAGREGAGPGHGYEARRHVVPGVPCGAACTASCLISPATARSAPQVKEGDRVIYFKYAGGRLLPRWPAHSALPVATTASPHCAPGLARGSGSTSNLLASTLKPAGDSMETPSGEKYNVLHESDILAKI